MAKRNLVSGRRKNLIMIFAILLSTFLLFTILTVGSTYFKMQRIQDVRMNGGDMNAYIYGGFTEKQKSVCEENPDIALVGQEAIAGWGVKTDQDDTLHTVFVWADEVMWDKLQEPAREWVKGTYPKKDNEVMATKEALEDCGLEGLDVGDSFTITYGDGTGEHTKEFTITGMWGGFGTKKVFNVSRSFFDQSGFQLTDYGRGFLYLKYASSIIPQKTQDVLEKSLELGEKQRLIYMSDSASSVQIMAGMAGLILITCISAYLLIYNILYLSVSGNTRYYGLLQTVGMTGRQVYALMKKRMLYIGAVGMTLGILLGSAASFLVIPWVVKTLGIHEEDIAVAFHPAIFLLCLILISLTIWLGGRKPAKIATSVSPVEALNYRPNKTSKESHKTGKGNLIWRMAREQFQKDKKKSTIVILSLAASLSVFLCLITLIASQGPRTMVSSFMDNDLTILDDTVRKEDQGEWKGLLDNEFLSEIQSNLSVKDVHPQMTERIVVPWEPEFSEVYMEKMYEYWMEQDYEEIKEEYQQHPEKFYSYMTAIDETEFDYLNGMLDDPVDKEEFMAGKSCILYQDDLDIDKEMLKGKSIVFSRYSQRDTPQELKIAGMTQERYYAGMIGITPNIIVSDAYMKETVEHPYVFRVGIDYQEEYDETVENEMKEMMKSSPYSKDFSYDSKLEAMKEVKEAQGNMLGVGIGIIVVLALIGIMNYINTVSGNIQSRQIEFAIMESVGMTDRQVKRMLVREGILFAAASLLLTATAGMAVTYMVYQSMNYIGVPFAVPVLPVMAMILFIFAVCVTVPLASYHMLAGRRTIVERVRDI